MIAQIYRDEFKAYLEACVQGIKETDRDSTDYSDSYTSRMQYVIEHANKSFNAEWIKDFASQPVAEHCAKLVNDLIPQSVDSISATEAMGKVLYHLESLSDLEENHHKVAHLALNYLSARCIHPMFRFNRSESYAAALQSESQTKILIADKIREAVIDRGSIWERYRKGQYSDSYKNSDGEQLIIQWNSLVAATREWQTAE